MKTFFSILVLVLIAAVSMPQDSRAQEQYNEWYFGQNAALDFNSGLPVSISGSEMSTNEGSASICDDKTGALLFYTDGSTVWNSNNDIMPNGTGLLGNFSSTQSAMIIGDPQSPNLYYLFTCDQGGYGGPNQGVNYSIVDMTLDGGLGAVTTKNVRLLDNATEKITAVRQPNSCNSWVIAHEFNSDAFYAWQVDDTGINLTPVISNVGFVQTGDFDETIGYLASSQDGTRLAQVMYYSGHIEVLDFDANTGQVSNPILLNGFTGVYGVCFSPDGNNLYVSQFEEELMQFDLTSNNPNTILANMIDIDDAGSEAAIMPGPDGRLYVSCFDQNYVGVINSPNNPGANCNYNSQEVFLSSGVCQGGLPNICYSYMNVPSHSCLFPSVHIASVPAICAGDCITPSAIVDNAVSYAWELAGSQTPVITTEDPGMVCFDSAGVYKITLTVTDAAGNQAVDSTLVIVNNPIALTFEAVGGKTDTIGGDVRVPISIVENGTFNTGSLNFDLTFDTANLQFSGFYNAYGNRVDNLQLDSNGKAFVMLDSVDIVNRSTLGYALFHVFPVTDSCFDVSFNNISLSPSPAGCVILNGDSIDGNSVGATVCGPYGCGTVLLSDFVRYGAIPSWNIAEIDAHHLQLNYEHLASDACLTIYDELGRSLVRQQVPSSDDGSIEINLPNSGNGKLFAVLTMGSGPLETREVFIAQ